MENRSTQPIGGPTGPALIPQIPRIQRDPLAFMQASVRQYGDLVQFPVGKLMVYLVNTPSAIKQVLQDNYRNYSKATIQYRQLASVTGNGLLTSDGDFWLRQRRLVQPVFHQRRIAATEPAIVDACQRMLDRWGDAARRGAPLNVDDEMMQLTLEIVGKVLFSIDFSREASVLTDAVKTALDHIVYRANHFLAPPAWVPTPRNVHFRSALSTLNRAVQQLIDSRRGHAQQPDDLLTLLLQTRDEDTGAGMDERQARDEILTLLIAGHETTASALTWSWYLLAQHKAVEDRLHRELDAVLAGRAPGSADLPALAYTRQVFDETLRLYPPAWLITRRAIGPDILDGHPIPAGSLIIISPYVIHRHGGWWHDPEAFDPDRFAAERQTTWPRFAYIPFGGGPRMCIGQHMALFEAHLILATIAQRYRLSTLTERPVAAESLVTLRPRGGLWMTVQARRSG